MPDITIPDAALEAAYHKWRRIDPIIGTGDIRLIIAAAAPHIAAQALRDAAKGIECQHIGSCLIVGSDYCNAPEDGAMVRSALVARARQIEEAHG